MENKKTTFDKSLSDPVTETSVISREQADRIFQFFRNCPLFRWQDANNDCEDRAHAACLLLHQWNIPVVKTWVFSGCFLKRDAGQLINKWNYHVAAALPVKDKDTLSFYIIDPATLEAPAVADTWADRITELANSYYLVKKSDYYIFNPAAFTRENWYAQNRQNYKWTMQGLAGINGVTNTGKAQLVFRKRLIAKTEKAFRQLLRQKPAEL